MRKSYLFLSFTTNAAIIKARVLARDRFRRLDLISCVNPKEFSPVRSRTEAAKAVGFSLSIHIEKELGGGTQFIAESQCDHTL